MCGFVEVVDPKVFLLRSLYQPCNCFLHLNQLFFNGGSADGGTPELEKGTVKAVQDLYDVVHHDILSMDLRENYETWKFLSNARTEGRLFAKLKWPKDPKLVCLSRLPDLLSWV
ncbi:callose synthase 9-like [Pyrus ussuriensis x Pyrus communis]|uniref:Callose synthase 9-like n=1 Tax=Pyrus ussuriensis x Pyrus communis TaxID=2448454 RepID=A0A5N5H1Z2_9ROSA|nr:callose synthase 9-like [Pyrus ussuriensis x Pyrus communis]